jgi:hypothetical protein
LIDRAELIDLVSYGGAEEIVMASGDRSPQK